MRCSCFIVLVTLRSFFPLVIGYCFWWSVFFILSSSQGGKTDAWCRYWAWFFFSSIHLFSWSSFMFDVSGKFEYCFFSKVKQPGICPRGSTHPQLVMSMVVVNKPWTGITKSLQGINWENYMPFASVTLIGGEDDHNIRHTLTLDAFILTSWINTYPLLCRLLIINVSTSAEVPWFHYFTFFNWLIRSQENSEQLRDNWEVAERTAGYHSYTRPFGRHRRCDLCSGYISFPINYWETLEITWNSLESFLIALETT